MSEIAPLLIVIKLRGVRLRRPPTALAALHARRSPFGILLVINRLPGLARRGGSAMRSGAVARPSCPRLLRAPPTSRSRDPRSRVRR